MKTINSKERQTNIKLVIYEFKTHIYVIFPKKCCGNLRQLTTNVSMDIAVSVLFQESGTVLRWA